MEKRTERNDEVMLMCGSCIDYLTTQGYKLWIGDAVDEDEVKDENLACHWCHDEEDEEEEFDELYEVMWA